MASEFTLSCSFSACGGQQPIQSLSVSVCLSLSVSVCLSLPPSPSLRSTTVIELHACAIRSKHPVAVVTDGYRHSVYYIGYDGNSVVTPQLPTCVLCNFRVSVMTVTLPVDC